MSLPIEWPETPNRLYTQAELQAAMHEAYAEGRADERERCEQLCAAEQAENRQLAKGSKTAMYDWMADGAGLCLGAIRSDSAAGVTEVPRG
jgi:hypothetical protein